MAELKSYTPKEVNENQNGVVSGKSSPTYINQVDVIEKSGENGLTPVEQIDTSHTLPATEMKNGKVADGARKGSGDSSKLIDGKEENPDAGKQVGVFEVFRFADCMDRLFMVLGSIMAAIHGIALPAMIIIFGEMIDIFVNNAQITGKVDLIKDFLDSVNLTTGMVIADPTIIQSKCADLAAYYNNTLTCASLQGDLTSVFMSKMEEYSLYYVYIALGVIVMGYGHVAFWMTAAERQSHRIRLAFLKNILRQDISWYDVNEVGELNTRLSDDINKIHDGIGDKMGNFLQWLSCSLAGFIIGFYYGWKLTLVILAISPALVISATLMSRLMASMTSKELAAYAKAGAVAEEVLGAVRTVVAFGGQEKECNRYCSNLHEAKAFGVRKGYTNGLSLGLVWLVMFSAYALGFWYGTKLVRDEPENYQAGKMIIVFFSVLIGAFSLGNAAPSLQALATARGAAYTIFKLIDLQPMIDSSSPAGKKPQSLSGTIQFNNVHFSYPSRPDVKVLNGLNLEVRQGQTVALVGASGCGKSTTVQLIQRFYDPSSGSVMLDGIDIKDLNICWLREHIGIVSQEPILFGTSISENIRYGREGVSQSEIEAAAKNANAHDFIMGLPERYDTMVGDRGAQLSGGQKQRVAIARALVRDPRILLLDEATSALDTESESIVQDALDHAREGRTTIVIAHRLSTIRTADIIAGFNEGVITEQGTHDDLMAKQGIYYQLVTNQTREKKPEDDEDDEIEMMVRVGSGRDRKVDLKHAVSVEEKTPKKSRQRLTSESKDKKEEEEEAEDLPKVSFIEILRLNSPEALYILFGCFAAVINGGIQPAFSVIFADILGVYQKSVEEQDRDVRMYALILLGLGVLSLFTNFAQSAFFGISGENMTVRIRRNVFKAMLRQEISWFDDHRNNLGALTTRLATDASRVQGATGVQLGMVVMNLANMGSAIVIAFIFSWKLTLVILAFVPFIMASGFIEMKVLAGVAGKNKEALEDAGKVAIESVENIRTVASLSREPTFYTLYQQKLTIPYNAALRKAHMVGISFGVSQAIVFFAHSAAFYFGAYLIKNGEADYVDVFKVFGAIVFGAMAIGQASAFAPDAAKAKVSAQRIVFLLKSEPTIDSESTEGEKLGDNYSSKVALSDVRFRYPTRPDVTVLQGLTVDIEPGQTLAFVGSSGCGKSTSVALIERFYDPEAGVVSLDRYDIKKLNLQWLRSQIGIVSQEPVLFDSSIAENIAYGDNSREVTMAEIIEAARAANIHSFISSLPAGYETNVGDKGAQLSGGQKQRVAIARALVRNPKILLLDEATSALDTESEKVVQEALDKAREGRTSIVIAHRLSTIQNADKIVVIRNGKVAEQGRHTDLMAKQGFYYKLNMAQIKQK
ncbi:ATP-dependent translocase ABCB1-like isoform X4 [Haliotis rufescens]|uniref:ATP-dependent translocase ABCB1-like isoform X4 n=1 Tax=Haliotis rufescens TaxID=6454 RepID=UPI00201FA8A9|nr:ATP-dependent translocase ABCB1-like isoform X4 [Haliotis rufescens]